MLAAQVACSGPCCRKLVSSPEGHELRLCWVGNRRFALAASISYFFQSRAARRVGQCLRVDIAVGGKFGENSGPDLCCSLPKKEAAGGMDRSTPGAWLRHSRSKRLANLHVVSNVLLVSDACRAAGRILLLLAESILKALTVHGLD